MPKSRFLRLLSFLGSILIAQTATQTSQAQDAAPNRPEPRLFRTTLRIEPTRAQVESMPAPAPIWRLPPPIAARFDDILAAGAFPETFSKAVREAFSIDPKSGDGIIFASDALLDLLPASKRGDWWALLRSYDVNRSYRWPIAIRATELDELENDARFSEAVRRILRWGVREGPRILFADLFALEGALPDPTVHLAFHQRLLGANTEFLKLISDTAEPSDIEATDAYWISRSRNREIDPFLAAVARLSGHDRIDIAHLLPRLPRSLLYTYPPDLELVEEPSRDNAALAAAFFSGSIDTDITFRDGFAPWLLDDCEPVSGPREYGDIVVFEDPARVRWPFAMVYIADGIVFGRRPTLYGPWEFLPENQIALLNPKLRETKVSVFRPRQPATTNTVPAASPLPKLVEPLDEELESLEPGPWGKLKAYGVLLAPSRHLLASIPAPDAQPLWQLNSTTSAELRAALAPLEMPASVRRDLLDLFGEARRDKRGTISVRPSPELVFALPAAAREALFARLVHGAKASDYAQDFYIPTSLAPQAWFAPDGLSDTARDALQALAYRRGNLTTLSDFGAFYHAIPDPDERATALQSLMRTPALVLLMERPAPAETQQLADYWRLDQQKSVRRLLESFATSADMAYLDVTHLLPPLARELSNVYTIANYDAPTPSCYWSALNFAAERPDSRLLITPRHPTAEVPLVWQKLRQGYRRVKAAGQLGDLIAYRAEANDEIRHICAFVAADVVFTKNGYGSSNPWCLMRLADVDAYYLESGITREVYRAK